jgi:hypothetical protein
VFAAIDANKTDAADAALERYLTNLAVIGELFSGEQAQLLTPPGDYV